MNEGDVVLASLTQSDGQLKFRPAVVLRQMPPFGDWLICGVSTQLRQAAANFDELIESKHDDFSASGLKATSLIRLGFIAALPANLIQGKIGAISPQRDRWLLDRLALHLRSPKM
jgi:mRNA interferase MazF